MEAGHASSAPWAPCGLHALTTELRWRACVAWLKLALNLRPLTSVGSGADDENDNVTRDAGSGGEGGVDGVDDYDEDEGLDLGGMDDDLSGSGGGGGPARSSFDSGRLGRRGHDVLNSSLRATYQQRCSLPLAAAAAAPIGSTTADGAPVLLPPLLHSSAPAPGLRTVDALVMKPKPAYVTLPSACTGLPSTVIAETSHVRAALSPLETPGHHTRPLPSPVSGLLSSRLGNSTAGLTAATPEPSSSPSTSQSGRSMHEAAAAPFAPAHVIEAKAKAVAAATAAKRLLSKTRIDEASLAAASPSSFRRAVRAPTLLAAYGEQHHELAEAVGRGEPGLPVQQRQAATEDEPVLITIKSHGAPSAETSNRPQVAATSRAASADEHLDSGHQLALQETEAVASACAAPSPLLLKQHHMPVAYPLPTLRCSELEDILGAKRARPSERQHSKGGAPEPGRRRGSVGGAPPGKRRRAAGGAEDGVRRGAGGAGSRAATGTAAPRHVLFKDIGGIESVLQSIRELILNPLAHPEVYAWLGVEPPRGLLLHGPPGCGKTMLASAIAAEAGVPLLKISAPEVVSGMSGESEAKVRSLFAEAAAHAPCIVFIDEIDAITPKRETAQREMERRIVAQLLTCMDDLSADFGKCSTNETMRRRTFRGAMSSSLERPTGQTRWTRHCGVLAASIGKLSWAFLMSAHARVSLRRVACYSHCHSPVPSVSETCQLLHLPLLVVAKQVLSQRLRLEGDFDFQKIARRTPGFVGADLAALTKEAAGLAVRRIFAPAAEEHIVCSPIDSPASPREQHQQGTCSPADGSDSAPSFISLSTSPPRASQQEDADVMRSGSRALAGPLLQEEWGGLDGPGNKAGEDGQLRRWSAEQMAGLSITMEDFEAAVEMVQPSAKREGFATIPGITWDDVGALADIREELEFSISRPIQHPEEYQAMGLEMATGVLLYGPPGCGKTLVAKAIANHAKANFISVKGPELLNKYVGESERAVRQLFVRARVSSPCVLFFDEMDAMAPRRGSDGNAAAERVVNQLLTEMDGLDSRKSIFIIAATNRPDMIDPALLRPGRLDKLLYVPLPDSQARSSIVVTLAKRVPLGSDVDLGGLAMSDRCTGFSGADLAALIREACIAAIKQRVAAKRDESIGMLDAASKGRPIVCRRHFEEAFERVLPSVSPRDLRRYEEMRVKLRCARGHLQKEPEKSAALPPAPPFELATGSR
eukprot:SM000190S04881  [mRNA]  locus=s190:222013:226623:- [translate_table: standard]